MASIDLREGNYPDAKAKSQKALEILQRIGDRYGEAATLYQLGQLAFGLGAETEGIKLVAMCFLIDQAIGHGDAKSDLEELLSLCEQMGYDEEQVHNALDEAAVEHRQDSGKNLILRAFDQRP